VKNAKTMRCFACYRACRYRSFRVFGDGAFNLMVQSLKTESESSSDWQYKRRSTILGRLHAEKLRAWERMISKCSHVGEWLGVGDIVRFWGHSPAGRREHQGFVVAVIPPHSAPWEIVDALHLHARVKLGLRRDHESYLVQIDQKYKDKRGKIRERVRLLWPPVSRIELIF
jgi:hypothetical protein